jgi:quercetin dioxygenase-like cupin family protein
MKIYNIKDMTRGWFVGDFTPCAYQTSDFEVGLLTHEKDEKWPSHYHKECTEINLLVSGKMKLQDTILSSGDIFVIPPYEIADPIFMEDCKVISIKSSSNPEDKHSFKMI